MTNGSIRHEFGLIGCGTPVSGAGALGDLNITTVSDRGMTW
jgi:hypothetical protein